MIEILLLAVACFIVGGIAGVIVTLLMAALVAASRSDRWMEEQRDRRKE